MSRRKQANHAAARIISRLRAVPTDGTMVYHLDTGYRVLPEKVVIVEFAQLVCVDASYIRDKGKCLYPGPIMKWRLRRLFRWWRDQVELPPICDHKVQSEVYWTQDGYTSQCRVCKSTVYHGD